MGTSVSQSSPRTTPWRVVATCYQSDQVSTERATTEIWRAAATVPRSLDAQIKSDGVFACYQLAKSGASPEQIASALPQIVERHGNSVVLELAKRATLVSATSRNPATEWPKQLFTQITGYLVSRDASGFVGPDYRNKSIGDLVSFKAAIGENVAQTVTGLRITAQSKEEWVRAATKAVATLAGHK